MPDAGGLYGWLSSLSRPPKPGSPGFKAFQVLTVVNTFMYQARTERQIPVVVLRRRPGPA